MGAHPPPGQAAKLSVDALGQSFPRPPGEDAGDLHALLRRRQRREARAWGVLAGTLLLLRTAVLAQLGLTDARYVLEMTPLMIMLAGVGVAALIPRPPKAFPVAAADDT